MKYRAMGRCGLKLSALSLDGWTTFGESITDAATVRAIIRAAYEHGVKVEQSFYNLLSRGRVEHDMASLVERYGLGVVVWGPLAFGLLTGKYDDDLPEGSRLARMPALRDAWYPKDHVHRVRQLRPIANRLGVTRAQLALAWLLERPHVSSVITGAGSVEQLESNLRAADLTLLADVRHTIEAIFPLEVAP